MRHSSPPIKITLSTGMSPVNLSRYSAYGRHAVSGILLVVALSMCWQLAATLRREMGGMAHLDTATHGQSFRQADQMAAEAANAHLFGLAQNPQNPADSAAESVNVTVDGIAYADDSRDSLAMLLVDGQSVAAHVGTVLATNETVTRILPDQVELTLAQKTRYIQLDIESTDLNQRIPFAALNAGGQSADTPAGIGATGDGPVIMPIVVNATPTARATMVQPHFLPIGELRGRKAAERFSNVKPP